MILPPEDKRRILLGEGAEGKARPEEYSSLTGVVGYGCIHGRWTRGEGGVVRSSLRTHSAIHPP